MALNDDDITTSGDGGEGPADGGSNPEGHGRCRRNGLTGHRC